MQHPWLLSLEQLEPQAKRSSSHYSICNGFNVSNIEDWAKSTSTNLELCTYIRWPTPEDGSRIRLCKSACMWLRFKLKNSVVLDTMTTWRDPWPIHRSRRWQQIQLDRSGNSEGFPGPVKVRLSIVCLCGTARHKANNLCTLFKILVTACWIIAAVSGG